MLIILLLNRTFVNGNRNIWTIKVERMEKKHLHFSKPRKRCFPVYGFIVWKSYIFSCLVHRIGFCMGKTHSFHSFHKSVPTVSKYVFFVRLGYNNVIFAWWSILFFFVCSLFVYIFRHYLFHRSSFYTYIYMYVVDDLTDSYICLIMLYLLLLSSFHSTTA